MINHRELWCNKWRLCVNKDNTRVMHFRNKRKARCNTKSLFERTKLEIVKPYKYLGVFLDFIVTANVLTEAAGRAFCAVLIKFRTFGNIGFKSFTKLFYSSVSPVLEYAS